MRNFLLLVLAACLVLGCRNGPDERGGAGEASGLTATPTQVHFGRLSVGTAERRVVLVEGAAAGDLELEVVGPFEAAPLALDGTRAGVVVTAVAKASGPAEGALTVTSAAGAIEVPLAFTTVDLPEARQPVLALALESVRSSPSSVTLRYLAGLDATRSSPGTLRLEAEPSVSTGREGLTIELPNPSIPLDARALRPILVTIDRAKLAQPNYALELMVRATGRVGPEAITALAAPIMLNAEQLLAMAPPPPPCDCPPGAPPPTLDEVLEDQTYDHPDPQGATPPSSNTVARVKVRLRGPRAGECCKATGASPPRFELSLTIDSQVGATHNALTAAFLHLALAGTSGFGLSVETNGTASKPAPGPNNGAMGGRAEVVATHEVPIDCAGADCECAVATSRFVTKLALTGPETGTVEVHWTVAVDGKDCTIASVSGDVERAVYTRGSQVYDPVSDRMLNKADDTDGDGTNDYDEVSSGTDANDASSRP